MYVSELHMALNHANIQIVRQVMRKKLQMIVTPPAPIKLTCTGFYIGKMSRRPHKLVTHNCAARIVICTDDCGPMRTPGRQVEKCLITLTDIASRYRFVLPRIHRSQVSECLRNAVQYFQWQVEITTQD